MSSRDSRSRRRFVMPLLAGVSLSVSSTACTGKEVVTENPPPPPEEMIATNPPPNEIGDGAGPPPEPSLPAWDDVESGHPENATNPPMPVLMLMEDGSRCWKAWTDPRRADRDAMLLGGKVLTDAAEAEGNTEIACPEKAKDVLAKYAEQKKETDEGAIDPAE